ncbi:MAG: protein kinase [Caldilineaceae bacterium]
MLNTAEFPQQIGPYQIEAETGQGYSAVVYRAVDTLYDRVVALKVLPAHLAQDTNYVRRFISSGREAARLRHPNIVQVFDAGQADGFNYIAQEYIDGGTLASRLNERSQPFTLYETEQFVAQLALALDYAHRQGETHGNLNPNNILFVSDRQVKIADFCLAQLLPAADPFYFPARVSTFMAPEQARGEQRIDHRADIYSLGILTYLMLTGRPPFQAENPLALARKIIDDEAPIESVAPGRLVPRVAHALQRVLAKQPVMRYLLAGDFAQAFLHGEPTPPPSAEPPPPAGTLAAENAPVDAKQTTAVAETAGDVVTLPAAVYSAPSPPAYTYTYPRRRQAPTNNRPFVSFPFLAAATLVLSFLTLVRIAWTTWDAPVMEGVGTPAIVAPLETAGGGLTPPFPPTLLTLAGGQRRNGMVLEAGTGTMAVGGASDPMIVAMSSAVESIRTQDAPPTLRVLPSLTTTDTPQPTETPEPPPTATETPAPTASHTATTAPSLTDTPTVAPTATPTEAPTETPTETPTLAPTPSPTASPASAASELGGRIAYTRWDQARDRYDMIFYSVASGDKWPIVRNRRQPDFSPQNNLAANGDGGAMNNLLLMRPNGEEPVTISAYAEDAHSHWAPSGKFLVFDSTRVGDGRRRLYLHRDTDYGQPIGPMMFEAWEIFGSYPVFLLDNRIAYNGCDVWENASNCGIFLVDTEGSKPTGFTTWPGDIPTDNLGYEILVMSNRNGNWDIYRMDPASGAALQLTDSAAQEGLATASPDGDYIAFISNREGQWAVYVMRTDGSEMRKLFDLDAGYGNGERDWLEERITWGR